MITRTMPDKERGELDPRFLENPFEELRLRGKVRVAPRGKSQQKRYMAQDPEHYNYAQD